MPFQEQFDGITRMNSRLSTSQTAPAGECSSKWCKYFHRHEIREIYNNPTTTTRSGLFPKTWKDLLSVAARDPEFLHEYSGSIRFSADLRRQRIKVLKSWIQGSYQNLLKEDEDGTPEVGLVISDQLEILLKKPVPGDDCVPNGV